MTLRQGAKDMADYLEKIDIKVDQLLDEARNAEMSLLQGISLALGEATIVHDPLGTVSATTGSKIEGSPTDLHIALSSGEFSSATGKIKSELPFWLAVLSTAITLQNRLAVPEIARVTGTAPHELDNHH